MKRTSPRRCGAPRPETATLTTLVQAAAAATFEASRAFEARKISYVEAMDRLDRIEADLVSEFTGAGAPQHLRDLAWRVIPPMREHINEVFQARCIADLTRSAS